MDKKRKGLLIAFEGSDGSGKATQSKILVQHLNKLGYKTETLSFPVYTSRYGKKIAAFLRGDYGTINQVSPYYIAKLFADDRKSHKKQIIMALSKGKIVILDRYVSSNLFQAAKMKSKKERSKFISWLYSLEYKKNKMPKEDMTFYLSLPVSVSQKLIAKKKKRSHLKGIKVDIQEKDIAFQKAVEKVYLKQIKISKHWKKIDCTKKGKLMSKKHISNNIFNAIAPLLKNIKK